MLRIVIAAAKRDNPPSRFSEYHRSATGGATARVVLPGGRVVSGEIDGGSGHSGKRAPEIHLGLGRELRDLEVPVEVAWRDAAGTHRRLLHLAVDRRHRVVLDGAAVAQSTPSDHQL